VKGKGGGRKEGKKDKGMDGRGIEEWRERDKGKGG
jgi:hypothetical protein